MPALTDYRQQINALDEQLVELLGRRYAVCRAVAQFKRENDLPMMQPARVGEVKERSAQLALRHDVDPDFARRLFGMIIDEACRLEDRIIDGTHSGAPTQDP